MLVSHQPSWIANHKHKFLYLIIITHFLHDKALNHFSFVKTDTLAMKIAAYDDTTY